MGLIRKLLRDDEGSISILILGLFLILLSTSLILTDISAVYLAKRSLAQITEAATQRGMRNLDEASYYRGEYNFTKLIENSLGEGEVDPGIPIDCNKGLADVLNSIQNMQFRGGEVSRVNLHSLNLDDFECDGYEIGIKTSAIAELPIRLPFINISYIQIESFAGAIGERASTNNYSGINFG